MAAVPAVHQRYGVARVPDDLNGGRRESAQAFGYDQAHGVVAPVGVAHTDHEHQRRSGPRWRHICRTVRSRKCAAQEMHGS